MVEPGLCPKAMLLFLGGTSLVSVHVLSDILRPMDCSMQALLSSPMSQSLLKLMSQVSSSWICPLELREGHGNCSWEAGNRKGFQAQKPHRVLLRFIWFDMFLGDLGPVSWAFPILSPPEGATLGVAAEAEGLAAGGPSPAWVPSGFIIWDGCSGLMTAISSVYWSDRWEME